jgi:hypothetical protein
MVMSKENVVEVPTSEEQEAPTFLQNLQGGQSLWQTIGIVSQKKQWSGIQDDRSLISFLK